MITNKTYETLRWLSEIVFPALYVLILALGKIWNLPYYTAIAGTVAAIGVFIGSVIRKSRNEYYKSIDGYSDTDSNEPPVEESFDDPDEYYKEAE
jgi:hypothetical protein